MTVPERLLIHDVTIVDPAENTNAYNDVIYDYGDAATRTTVKAWVQQQQRSETFQDGRAPDKEGWQLITNHPSVPDKARFEWTSAELGAATFELDGPPQPVYSGLAQAFHHTEAFMQRVEG